MPTVYATRADLAMMGLPPALLATVTPAKQDAALSAASATADGYLARRYKLPLTAWGADIRQRVCAIAAYQALATSGIEEISSDLRQRSTDAEKWLEGVAAGDNHPTVTDSAPAGTQSEGPVILSRPKRGWSR